jgi:iron only hydrogenase large subunit-like protein
MVTSTPVALEAEDHSRDAAFKKAMHGNTATEKVGFSAMMSKDKEAQKAAVDEYFKYWDNKGTTDEDTAVSSSTCPGNPEYIMLNGFAGAHGCLRHLDETLLQPCH